MSFAVEPLQSRKKHTSQSTIIEMNYVGWDENSPSKLQDEPLISVLGEAARSAFDSISNAIIGLRKRKTVETRNCCGSSCPIHDGVVVKVGDEIVYDYPSEDGFTEVGVMSDQPSRPCQPKLAGKLPPSRPVDIPINPKLPPRSKRKEKNYI